MRAFLVGVLCAVAQFATAQCPYNVSASLGSQTVGPTPAITCVETPSSSGHWVITVTAHGLSSTGSGLAGLDVSVSGGSSSTACSIIIDATDGAPRDGKVELEVALQLGQFTDRIYGIVQLVTLSDGALDTALVITDDSWIEGDLIELYANAIAGSIFVDGDVGSVYLESAWSALAWYAGDVAGSWQITGSLTGVIYVNGRIHDLEIASAVGSPTSHAAVLTNGDGVAGGGGGGSGVGRFVSGPFYGNLDILADVPNYAYPSVNRIFIGGDLHGDVFVPFALETGLPIVEVDGNVYGAVSVGTMAGVGANSKVLVHYDLKPGGVIDIFRWMRISTLEPPILQVSGDIDGSIRLGALGGVITQVQQGTPLGTGEFADIMPEFQSFGVGSVLQLRGTLWQEAVLNIHGSFLGHLQVLSGATIAGQIIVNADAAGGTLAGSATLYSDTAPIPLQPFPLYNNPATQLGGGAIGAVPFNLHAADSFPPSGYLIKLRTTDPTPDRLHIHHYGPIRFASSGNVIIERRPYYAPSSWTPVPFTPTLSVSTIDQRVLLIENGVFEPDYEYRVRPNGYILCDGNTLLSGTDVAVAEYTYTVHVRTILDRNMNGLIESGDVSLQITDPIDVNGDGVADVIDLMEVIHATGG